MDKSNAQSIEDAIKELIDQIAPDVHYVAKYGGEVIVPNPDDAAFVGGIFAYNAHVSLEFSEGASFDDPNGHLDGKGKNRRHLKLESTDDVAAKDTMGFLKQALA
jgi:hypothetical protein